MRLIALTALIATAALTGLAEPALAQTAAPAETSRGVSVADARAWLTGLGGQVSEPETAANAQLLRIADHPLPWTLTLYACTTLCDDLQFTATFTGRITEAQVTAWNRDNRYVAAAWYPPATAGGEATVVARQDLLLIADGTAQLQEPTFVWLQQLRALARYLAGQNAPAVPPAGQ